MKKIASILIIWLIAINVFAIFANQRLVLSPDVAYKWIDSSVQYQQQGQGFFALHNKWDSLWYLDIAKNGYSYVENSLSNIVFFPLYPLVMKFFTFGFIPLEVAGWIVSVLSLFGALIFLFKITEKFHPNISSYEPLLYLLLFPTAFFLNATYTESLFLFLSVLTFYLFLKKNYMGAGIVGLLASLTRINGVLLMIPFLIEIIINERKKEGGFEIKSFLKKSLPMLLILLGPLMFFIYHYVQFGDFFAFFNVESTFGRSFVVNQDHLAGSDFVSRSNMYFDMTIAILVFIAGVITMYRVRLSYGLYILATLFLPLSTGTLMSIGRYVLVAFPIFILMASFKNIYIKWSYVLVSILMCAMITILFVNNGWAG